MAKKAAKRRSRRQKALQVVPSALDDADRAPGPPEPPKRCEVATAPPEPLLPPATAQESGFMAESGIAIRELLGFEVRHIPHFPRATTLHLVTLKPERPFMVTTHRVTYDKCRQDGNIIFAGGELVLIATAAQNDRFFADQLHSVLDAKERRPSARITHNLALGPIYDAVPLSWTLEEVLTRVGARLLAVRVHE